jgi:diguanylate cyclase (GGDEF)-like protein
MSRTFRYLFIAGVVLIQAVTVAAIIISTRVANEDVLVDHMEQILANVAAEAVENTEGFLAPAEQAAALTVGLDGGAVVPSDDDELLEQYFLEQLRVNSQIAGMFVGRPDGSFVYVSRDACEVEATYRTKVIAGPAAGGGTTLTCRDDDLEVLLEEPDPADDYDPRTRPWYEAATTADDLIWTDPYIFFTSRSPGVTAAIPLGSDGGEIEGVVGVDIELLQLSDFVGGQRISDSGLAFIVDRGGAVVAYRDSSAIVRDAEEGDGLDQVPANEFSDPVVRAAYDALGGTENLESLDTRSFSFEGETYFAVYTPLPGTDWVAIVTAPEDDFVGDIRNSNRLNALIAVAIGLGVVILMVPLLARFSSRVERLEQRATTDSLTMLPNRGAFEITLKRAVERARRRDKSLVALVADIDQFKVVNDTHGHAVGDEVLTAVAGRMGQALRDTDVVGRVGGDEFVAMIVDLDAQEAAEVAERMRSLVGSEPVSTSRGEVVVTVSIGLAELTPAMESAEELVDTADQALLRAKQAGRDRVVITSTSGLSEH